MLKVYKHRSHSILSFYRYLYLITLLSSQPAARCDTAQHTMPHTHPTRHALLYTLSLLTLIIFGFLTLHTTASPNLHSTPSRFSRRQLEEEADVEPFEPDALDIPGVDVPDVPEVDLEPPLTEEEGGEIADPLPAAPDTPADPGFDISKPIPPATPGPGISLITSCTTFTVARGNSTMSTITGVPKPTPGAGWDASTSRINPSQPGRPGNEMATSIVSVPSGKDGLVPVPVPVPVTGKPAPTPNPAAPPIGTDVDIEIPDISLDASLDSAMTSLNFSTSQSTQLQDFIKQFSAEVITFNGKTDDCPGTPENPCVTTEEALK